MTDKEKLKKLLTEFGVGFEEHGNNVDCNSGNEKITGYVSFCTTFKFDSDGKFTEMGAWE